MAKLFAVCVLILCFSLGFGRKCYMCSSKTSLDDCNESKKEESCSSGVDYCGTLSLEYKLPDNTTTKQFKKGCSTKAACDDPSVASSSFNGCKDAGGECSYECCDSDLCNGGNAVPMVSTFLMLACALATFLR